MLLDILELNKQDLAHKITAMEKRKLQSKIKISFARSNTIDYLFIPI